MTGPIWSILGGIAAVLGTKRGVEEISKGIDTETATDSSSSASDD